jgi:hypothetical protein
MIKTPHTSRSTASRASLQTYYTHFNLICFADRAPRGPCAVGCNPLGHTICTCLIAFGHDKALLGAQPSAVAPSRVIYGSPPSTVMDVLHERHPCTSAARASVCLVDGDLHLLWGVRPQGAAFGVVGQGDLAGAQVADDLDSAGRCGVWSRQEDVQGSQMGQDAVLANVEVSPSVGI